MYTQKLFSIWQNLIICTRWFKLILRLPCILISWKGYLYQTDRVKQIAYLYDTLFSVLLIIHCISPIPWDGGVCKRIKRGQHYNTLCILIEINRLKWDDRWIISDIILLFSCSIYHMTIYFWYPEKSFLINFDLTMASSILFEYIA